MSSSSFSELAKKIDGSIKATGKTAAEVCHRTLVNKSVLSTLRSGKRGTSLANLVRLAAELDLDLVELVLLHGLGEAYAKAEKTSGVVERRQWMATADELVVQIARFRRGERWRGAGGTGPTTLADWGTQRLDVKTVFVGGRRSRPPTNVYDLLALPASVSDLYLLPALGLSSEVRVRPDVFVKQHSARALSGFLDHDVLILGAGPVNYAARAVNDRLGFPFIVNPATLAREAELERAGAGLTCPKLLEFQRREELYRGDALSHGWLQGFVSGGWLDRATKGVICPLDTRQRLFGVITMGPSPWSEGRHVVLVAGRSASATIAGMKLLRQPDQLEQHPRGGVFYVDLDTRPVREQWEDLHPCWHGEV